MKKENIKRDENVQTGMKIESDSNTEATSAANKGSAVNQDGDDESETAISPEELKLLNESGRESKDEDSLQAAQLDNKDNDGELLNVSSSADDKTGRDLDVPGADEDDDMEDIGEEDEENNPYSLSDNND